MKDPILSQTTKTKEGSLIRLPIPEQNESLTK